MLHREMLPEDRRRLAAGSARRERVELPGLLRVGECREDRRALHSEWARFLGGFPLDTFFTMTYSDEYAARHRVYAMCSALNDFERWVKEIDFRGQYFVAAEPHFDRDVPHLHGLMESRGLALKHYWADWHVKRGRCRIEEPRTDAVRYYCSKYSLKEADPDTVRFELHHLTRKERRGVM